MKENGKLTFLVLTCTALLLLAIAAVFRDRPQPPEPVPPGTAELVATTDSGVRVWKVTGPGLVVPYVFAESKSGSLSSR